MDLMTPFGRNQHGETSRGSEFTTHASHLHTLPQSLDWHEHTLKPTLLACLPAVRVHGMGGWLGAHQARLAALASVPRPEVRRLERPRMEYTGVELKRLGWGLQARDCCGD